MFNQLRCYGTHGSRNLARSRIWHLRLTGITMICSRDFYNEHCIDLCLIDIVTHYSFILKVTGDSLHQEIFASTEQLVSQQRKLL